MPDPLQASAEANDLQVSLSMERILADEEAKEAAAAAPSPSDDEEARAETIEGNSNLDLEVAGPSPIQQTVWDPKLYLVPDEELNGVEAPTQFGYAHKAAPISIRFLTGLYQGQSLTIGEWLGVAIPEVTHSVSAEWNSRGGDKIRSGLDFSKLGDRTFSFSVMLHAYDEDVAHLVENLVTLLQIGADDPHPPKLMLKQGSLIASPCVCTKADPSYSIPLSGNRGYRHAEVALAFTLEGGTASKHALGRPLTSTPLTDFVKETTDQERREIAVEQTASDIFAPCLESRDIDHLTRILREGVVREPAAWMNLSDEAFAQVAVSGILPAQIFEHPLIQQRLETALAKTLSINENGLGPTEQNAFRSALLRRSSAVMPPDLKGQADQAIADYQLILESINTQSLGDDSPLFDRSTNPTAGDRFSRSLECGLSLRQIGAENLQVFPQDQLDEVKLYEINHFLDQEDDPAKIATAFGVSKDQARQLRSNRPYATKEEFLAQQLTRGDGGMASHSAWSNFGESESESADGLDFGSEDAVDADAEPSLDTQ